MNDLTPEQLDGRMVRVISDRYSSFTGEARAAAVHGWIYVYLDAVDPEDERVIGPLVSSEVELIEAV